jgi:hypothetical protein
MPLASLSVGQEGGGHCLHSLQDGLMTLHLHYCEFSDITKDIPACIQHMQEQLDNMTLNMGTFCNLLTRIWSQHIWKKLLCKSPCIDN